MIDSDVRASTNAYSRIGATNFTLVLLQKFCLHIFNIFQAFNTNFKSDCKDIILIKISLLGRGTKGYKFDFQRFPKNNLSYTVR